jgi:hypothetical protein
MGCMMTEEVLIHKTDTQIVQLPPDRIGAGTDLALKIQVSCAHACDLREKTIQILAQDGTLVKEIALTNFQAEINETDEFTVKAPNEIGECTWSVVFPAQAIGEVPHEASSTSVKFNVKPHMLSVVAWDFPSPTILNSQFAIKVGVKCTAECRFEGKQVQVYDEKGAQVATGKLGETPLPQTSGLYWGEVKLLAPPTEDVYSWTIKFPTSGLELPHEEASTRFHFRTAKPPEHIVTVQVIDQDSKMPVKNVHVLVDPFRTFTDEQGMANLKVPKGKHEFFAAKDDYETFQTGIEVVGDITLNVKLVPAPF